MRKDDFNLSMSNCINNGVIIYPKYIEEDIMIGDYQFLKGNWHIAVNNNGAETIYKKIVGNGTVLKSQIKKTKRQKSNNYEWVDAIKKTYIFWSNKINEELKK